MLYTGMLLQAIALVVLVFAYTMFHFILLSSSLGWGTAMVYPTFLATVAENTHPQDRAKSIGVFMLWRDLGYAIGAILTGIIADLFNINTAILFIGLLTFASSMVIRYRMKCQTGGAVKIPDRIMNKHKRQTNTATANMLCQ
ncbi:MAG TPA: MFS transporter [Ferruginibacter sp.]|nr:MFS transporter [Ferruginibacter sp.]